jgi:hypothetical protein
MVIKQIKFLTLFILLLSIVSCGSISTLNLDVLRPAEVTIDPEILSVVVVDNSLPYRSAGLHTIKTPKETSTIDTLWIDDFPQIAIIAMTNELRNKQFFDAVHVHFDSEFENTFIGKGYLPENTLLDKIQYLCNIYNTQAVIFLESYTYKTNLNLTYLGDVYYGTMDVNGFICWKIYEQNGYLLDTYMQSDSIFWDATETNYNVILKQLPRQTDATEVLAEYLGETYIKRVAPYWETVARKYYSKGHFLFVRANDLHIANNWEDAAKVWYYVYENGNKRQKAMAAFNIALSYEVRSNFDEAIAWADICNKLIEKMGSIRFSNYEKKLANLYYTQLTERMQQIKKLDAQIGSQ